MSASIALLVLPLLAASPAVKHHPKASPDDSSNMAIVVVQNDRRQPITVYAQNATGEFELGVVPPDSVVTLRVPDLMLGGGATVDFFVHPTGGFDQESGFLEMRTGDRIGLVVPTR